MKNRNVIVPVFNSLMILAAITAALMVGILGYGRPHGPGDISQYDFHVIYSAGKSWWNGLNPYDLTGVKPGDFLFPYPPNSSFIFMLLSITNYEISRILFWLTDIVSIMIFSYCSIRIYNSYNASLSHSRRFFLYDFKSSLLVFMIIVNSFIINMLWVGQSTIMFSTALLCAYFFYIQSSEIMAGILLAVALNKPQLSYAFFIWLLLERKWKIIISTLVTTFILTATPIYERGLLTTLFDWIHVLQTHEQSLYHFGFWNLIGIRAMFYDFGIHLNSPMLFLLSVLLIITIHHYYYDINIFNLLGILVMIALLFVQTHQYDIFVLATILPYYFVTIRKHNYFKFAMLCLVFIALNFPHRKILLLSNHRILHHHRDIIVILLLLSQFIHWDRIRFFKKPDPALLPG